METVTEDIFIVAVLVCSAHLRFDTRSALDKFTFDIDIYCYRPRPSTYVGRNIFGAPRDFD